MRNKVIAFVAALGIAFAVATPAKAQFWGPYYGGYGYYGYGYGAAAIAGAAIAGAAIAAATSCPYYNGCYAGGYYAAPVPVYGGGPTVVQRKQIIIKNSPGARVVEQDIFDW
jgi:hypothetical protein